MTCPVCGAVNSKEADYCHKCGTALTKEAAGQLKLRETREKKARENELTESVFNRLHGWLKIYLVFASALILIAGVLLGKEWWSLDKRMIQAEGEIDQKRGTVLKQLGEIELKMTPIASDVATLEKDTARYKKVDTEVSRVQTQLLELKGDVVDLKGKTLRVGKFQATSEGPGQVGLGQPGCALKGMEDQSLILCSGGNPVTVYVMHADGKARPVASFSPTGFQDTSVGPKPNCDEQVRGTLYVEKGRPDRAFVCANNHQGRLEWSELQLAPSR